MSFDDKINHELFKDINVLKKLRHQSDYYLEVPPKGTKAYENWIIEDTDYAINLAKKIINLFKNQFDN